MTLTTEQKDSKKRRKQNVPVEKWHAEKAKNKAKKTWWCIPT
jgi:hypothetical protein